MCVCVSLCLRVHVCVCVCECARVRVWVSLSPLVSLCLPFTCKGTRLTLCVPLCTVSDLRSKAALQALYIAREGRLLGKLAQSMQSAGPGPEGFDNWMLRQSDLVQAVAMAYAEREVLEASWRAAEQVETRSLQ